MIPPTPILSREQIRAYDAHAIEACAVPGLILMENAGRGAAEIIAAHAGPEPVVIVAGRGNNGGDGFVIARHLAAGGVDVEVFVVGPVDAIGGDAKVNLDAWRGLGGAVHLVGDDLEPLRSALTSASLAVDALFGTGLNRPLEGQWAAAVHVMNHAPCPVAAVDIPSGIDGDTGVIHGVAVQAAFTVTFAHLKAGLVQGPGIAHLGELFVVGLGVMDAPILEKVGWTAQVIAEDRVADTVGRRAVDTHKYKAGSVLVIAGSEGKTGAALLCADGALRAGAGVVTIATWPDAAASLDARVTEVMTARIDPDDIEASLTSALDRRRAVAIGPGFGTDARAIDVVERIGLMWEGPAVLDADAISCLAGRPEVLRKARGARILTPHAGELARLMGTTSSDVEANRFEAARAAADATGSTIVLKGHRTVIATANQLDVNMTGDAVLATAGSGDVLTGILGALLAAEPSAHEAATASVYLHALAGKRWRDRIGADRGMIAHEIADELPGAIGGLWASGQSATNP
jgi:ADP-dependent NAD(P)H-hydrate dehydratase / NAD(P)H-hydrate epimerase